MAKQLANLKGWRELEKALHKLPLEIRREIAIEGTRKAANFVARDARGRAPEGDGLEYLQSTWHMEQGRTPGQLKRSIEVYDYPNKRPDVVGTAVQSSYRSISGTDIRHRRYPVLIELGWTNLYSRNKIEPSRFLRNALYRNGRKILNVFTYWGRKKLKATVAAAKK